MLEMEAVDGVAGVQSGEAEAALDGAAVARLKFAVDQRFESLGEAAVLCCRIRDRLIQLVGHRRQAELVQFRLKWRHWNPFENEE